AARRECQSFDLWFRSDSLRQEAMSTEDPTRASASGREMERTLVTVGSFAVFLCAALMIQQHGAAGLTAIADRFRHTAATDDNAAGPAGPSFVQASAPADEGPDGEPPPLPP